jgi:flagellar L-ring protein precursor FlgH
MAVLRRLLPVAALLLLPAIAAAQGATVSADAESAPRPRHSWTSDRREFAAGDILTVLVDEQTLASASKGQTGTDETSRKNGLDITPPAGPTGSTPVDVSVGTNKRSSSRQSGEARRDLRFRGEMTVRIVKIEPNGVLEVKGTRTVDVDKNKQTLTLTGFVRPEDITRTNVIESARIADAQVLYAMQGDLGGTRGGIIGRLISVFWP